MNTRSLLICTAACGVILGGCDTIRQEANESRSVRGLYSEGPQGLSRNAEYYDHAQKKVTTSTLPTLVSDLGHAKVTMVQANPPTQDMVQDFVEAGIAVSNQACHEWFENHNTQLDYTNTTQSIMNVVGDAAIGVMGIAGAGVSAMSYVALALGGANGGYETFKEGHFLTSTIWALRDGVLEGRKISASNLRDAAKKDGYNRYRAENDLLTYHNTCSRLALISYIEGSVELSRYVPRIAAPGAKVEQYRLSNEVNKAITGKAGGVYNEAELAKIYAIAKDADSAYAKQLLTDTKYQTIKTAIDGLGDNALAQFHINLDELDKLADLKKLNEIEILKAEQAKEEAKAKAAGPAASRAAAQQKAKDIAEQVDTLERRLPNTAVGDYGPAITLSPEPKLGLN